MKYISILILLLLFSCQKNFRKSVDESIQGLWTINMAIGINPQTNETVYIIDTLIIENKSIESQFKDCELNGKYYAYSEDQTIYYREDRKNKEWKELTYNLESDSSLFVRFNGCRYGVIHPGPDYPGTYLTYTRN